MAKIMVLLKEGKFAGYEPRKEIIKETITKKRGKEPDEKELEKIFQQRLNEFLELPSKNNKFKIVDREKP